MSQKLPNRDCEQMAEKPNIILICSDQHNPRITGCYGNTSVRTPNIDRLAKEGLYYRNAYCNQPICVPSRMSFMTGRYPSKIGVLNNSQVLDSRIPTFAHLAAAARYRTVLAGRMHFVGPDQYHGFQEHIASDHTAYAFHTSKINRYEPLNGLLGNGMRPDPLREVGEGVTCTQTLDKLTTAAAVDWLDKHSNEDDHNPFLMTVGYFSPHCPYIAETNYYQRYRGLVTAESVTADEIASLHPYHRDYRESIAIDTIPVENLDKAAAAYYGLVDFLDDQIGILLNKLENLGLMENTVVIYLSDHGEMLGEHGRWHKQTFFDASSCVPFIIRLPAGKAKHATIDTPVSLVDLFPTVAGLVGASISFSVDGCDLLAPEYEERPVFSEYHDKNGSHRMIREGRFKLNYYAGYESYELFDMQDDPDEKTNLSENPFYADVELTLCQKIFADGWSGTFAQEHDKYLKQLGYYPGVTDIGPPTRDLIEAGIIIEIPGYDPAVAKYKNKLW